MKHLLSILILFTFMTLAGATCIEEENIEAYNFAQKVKQSFEKKDLSAVKPLIAAVEDNLYPMPNFTNKSFEDLFSNEWNREILNSEIECHPLGLKGWMLGNGKIWYGIANKHYISNSKNKSLAIFSINIIK